MCVAGGTALHRQHQAVTADAGECAAALGNVGRAVVRTAGTEMRWAFGQARQAAQRGALVHQARNPRRQFSIASACEDAFPQPRSEEHTSELQSLMRISYAVFCVNKTKNQT